MVRKRVVRRKRRKRQKGGSLSSLLRHVRSNYRKKVHSDVKKATRLAIPALKKVTKKAFLGLIPGL